MVTASSSNPALIPNPTVTYTSPNATGSLAYTPVANTSGSAVITVTVSDGGATHDAAHVHRRRQRGQRRADVHAGRRPDRHRGCARADRRQLPGHRLAGTERGRPGRHRRRDQRHQPDAVRGAAGDQRRPACSPTRRRPSSLARRRSPTRCPTTAAPPTAGWTRSDPQTFTITITAVNDRADADGDRQPGRDPRGRRAADRQPRGHLERVGGRERAAAAGHGDEREHRRDPESDGHLRRRRTPPARSPIRRSPTRPARR